MWAGLFQVVAGLLALAADPVFIFTRNAGGIPRWAPHGVAVCLGVAALVTWRPRIDCGVLAGWWALAAGAFSAPSLLHMGWPTLSPLVLVPAGVLVFAVATQPARGLLAFRARWACVLALAAPFGVFLALSFEFPAAHGVDAAAYTFILASAGFSAWHGLTIRRLS